jgi:hypothetical protein
MPAWRLEPLAAMTILLCHVLEPLENRGAGVGAEVVAIDIAGYRG